MNSSRNIRANFRLGSIEGKCEGELHIGKPDDFKIPVTWKLRSETGEILAFSGLQIYLGENHVSEECILEKIKNAIENFRSERSRIFSDVRIF